MKQEEFLIINALEDRFEAINKAKLLDKPPVEKDAVYEEYTLLGQYGTYKGRTVRIVRVLPEKESIRISRDKDDSKLISLDDVDFKLRKPDGRFSHFWYIWKQSKGKYGLSIGHPTVGTSKVQALGADKDDIEAFIGQEVSPDQIINLTKDRFYYRPVGELYGAELSEFFSPFYLKTLPDSVWGKTKKEAPKKTTKKAPKKSIAVEDSSKNLSIYEYKSDERTRLDSFEDFLKSLQKLPTRIAFVYKSPIGYFVIVTEYLGGAVPSKKSQKSIENSLSLTSMYIEDLLSHIGGRVLVVSNAIVSINKSKKTMETVFFSNLKFTNKVGIKAIQDNVKPLMDLFWSRYTSSEIISQIPQTKKRTQSRFKNWSVFPVKQNVVQRKFFIVMITRAEAKKYPSTEDKRVELLKLARKNKILKSVNDALIQIVILRPKSRRGNAITNKYEHLSWLLFTLRREAGRLTVSEATFLGISNAEKTELVEYVWKQLEKIDKEIP